MWDRFGGVLGLNDMPLYLGMEVYAMTLSPSQQDRLREIRSSLLDCNHGDGCQRDRCGHSKQSALFLLSMIDALQEDTAHKEMENFSLMNRLAEQQREIERLDAEMSDKVAIVARLTEALEKMSTQQCEGCEGVRNRADELSKNYYCNPCIARQALSSPASVATPERRLAERDLETAVRKVKFGYAGDVGNTVSGWEAVEAALARLEGSDAKTSE